jgi:hypothetical protein
MVIAIMAMWDTETGTWVMAIMTVWDKEAGTCDY